MLEIDGISYALANVNKLMNYLITLRTELSVKVKHDKDLGIGYLNKELLPWFESNKQEVLAIQENSLMKKSFKLKYIQGDNIEQRILKFHLLTRLANYTPVSTIAKLIGQK